MLSVPPAQRDTNLLTELLKLTANLAGEYFSSLTEGQHRALAKAWRYQWFAPGQDICLAEEECTSFFIVLEGLCLLSERQVHHLEGRNGTDGWKRLVSCRRGRAFGHYPLVYGDAKYDYTARSVDAKHGCWYAYAHAMHARLVARAHNMAAWLLDRRRRVPRWDPSL